MVRNVLLGCAGVAALAMSAHAQDVNIPADFPTIQQGIDNVGPGGTVWVGPGVYNESLIIDPTGVHGTPRGQSMMRIESTTGNVTVQWALGAHVLPAPVTSTDGSALDYVLLAQGVSALEIVDIAFNGQNDITSGMLSCGIALLDTTATLSECDLGYFQESATGADDNGIGIRVEGLSSVVTIIQAAILYTQTAHISVVAGAKADIFDCQLFGRGPTGSLPQHGVVFGGPGTEAGGHGTVDNSELRGFWFTGATLQAAGIRNFFSGAVSATNNEFINCQVGVHDLSKPTAVTTIVDRNVFTQLDAYTTGVLPSGVIINDGDLSNDYLIKDNRFNKHEGPGVILLTEGGVVQNNFFNTNGAGTGNINCKDDGAPGGNLWIDNTYTDYRSNANWPSNFLIPGLAGAVDWDAMGIAEATVYGMNNPPGSMRVLAGRPATGTTFIMGVDNPLGTMATNSICVFAFSGMADPNFPNGTPVPWGMDGGGADLLLNPAGLVGAYIAGLWSGPGSPAPFPLAIPDEPSLVGLPLYVQGALAGGGAIGLSRGLQLQLGY